jgi:hypothetical protein
MPCQRPAVISHGTQSDACQPARQSCWEATHQAAHACRHSVQWLCIAGWSLARRKPRTAVKHTDFEASFAGACMEALMQYFMPVHLEVVCLRLYLERKAPNAGLHWRLQIMLRGTGGAPQMQRLSCLDVMGPPKTHVCCMRHHRQSSLQLAHRSHAKALITRRSVAGGWGAAVGVAGGVQSCLGQLGGNPPGGVQRCQGRAPCSGNWDQELVHEGPPVRLRHPHREFGGPFAPPLLPPQPLSRLEQVCSLLCSDGKVFLDLTATLQPAKKVCRVGQCSRSRLGARIAEGGQSA